MSILSEIYEGWKNYLFENPEVEEEAKNRMKICVECEKFRTNQTCEMCGCFMPAKVRSKQSHCPENKWKSMS